MEPQHHGPVPVGLPALLQHCKAKNLCVLGMKKRKGQRGGMVCKIQVAQGRGARLQHYGPALAALPALLPCSREGRCMLSWAPKGKRWVGTPSMSSEQCRGRGLSHGTIGQKKQACLPPTTMLQTREVHTTLSPQKKKQEGWVGCKAGLTHFWDLCLQTWQHALAACLPRRHWRG